jgi:nucleotide-binding universal stress UspA family protein
MSAERTATPRLRIVVGVDGSPSAAAALRWALRQAEASGATVDAVIAWQTPVAYSGYGWVAAVAMDPDTFREAATKQLAETVAEVAQGSAAHVEQQVIEGYAPRVLVNAARDADLLVVGNRGHNSFADALLGSVSQYCAHHAGCPVVIMRGAERAERG